MYKYKYKALLNNSWAVGYINAPNKTEALRILRNMFTQVLSVNRSYYNKPTRLDRVIEWFNTLSLLMKEGVRIEDALLIMSEQKEYKFSKSLAEIIKSGKSFDKALNMYQYFFDEQSLRIVTALSKFLPIEAICDFVSKYKMKIYNKQNTIKKSIIQPIITFGLSFVMCIGLMFYLKQPIEMVASDLGAEIPKIFVIMNSLNIAQIILAIGIFIGLVYLLFKYHYKLPFIKDCLIDRDFFIAFYFLGNGLKNGLSIIEAIEVSIAPLKTKFVRKIISNMKNDLMKGSSVFLALKNTNISHIYLNIIRVNEIAGNLADGFMAASNSADVAFDKKISMVDKILGPAVTILTSIFIIYFLNSVIFPMYSCVADAFTKFS